VQPKNSSMIINIHQISISGPSLYVAPCSFEISIPEIQYCVISEQCKLVSLTTKLTTINNSAVTERLFDILKFVIGAQLYEILHFK